jgi:hypothetical protein
MADGSPCALTPLVLMPILILRQDIKEDAFFVNFGTTLEENIDHFQDAKELSVR